MSSTSKDCQECFILTPNWETDLDGAYLDASHAHATISVYVAAIVVQVRLQ